ncbi:hypothetical protein AMAG_09660 [Allomyces macrogynus ATCC 38327]|uniref:Mechanosensitive ion channel MscS domain-containing protein n=1 Tax=Allomyces macrogynus (strain ATCC 38327) TaxID=578462 RepID=A0A0L0ST49_ALLM3|nr:hypothetical protein AMAG_09660 [Allomyces macrogynus ATCC 38327]|eukprot:KNE65676.1 hypothetical protein AMAG_09660 [Allomyces macrogynus ATCC 38327]
MDSAPPPSFLTAAYPPPAASSLAASLGGSNPGTVLTQIPEDRALKLVPVPPPPPVTAVAPPTPDAAPVAPTDPTTSADPTAAAPPQPLSPTRIRFRLQMAAGALSNPFTPLDDDFDWLQLSERKRTHKHHPEDPGANRPLPPRRPTWWSVLPKWARSLLILVLLVILFAVPAAVALALNPSLIHGTVTDLAASELVLWTATLEAALIGHHMLYFIAKGMLTSAKMGASFQGLGVVFHIEQLSAWMSFVFATLAAWVAEMTILHAGMCAPGGLAGVAMAVTAVAGPEMAYLVSARAANTTTTTTTTSTTTSTTTTSNSSAQQTCAWPGWWIKNALGALFVTSVLYFVEKVVLQRIAIQFHRKQYAERIRQARLFESVLEALIDARRAYKRAHPPGPNSQVGAETSVWDLSSAMAMAVVDPTRSPRWNLRLPGRVRRCTSSPASPQQMHHAAAPASPVSPAPTDEFPVAGALCGGSDDGILANRTTSTSRQRLVDDPGDADGDGDGDGDADPEPPTVTEAGGPPPAAVPERGLVTVVSPQTSATTASTVTTAANATVAASAADTDPRSLRPRMTKIGVNSKYDARRLAWRLFVFLCPEDRAVLYLDDFKAKLPENRHADCAAFFGWFDKNTDREISKREFRDGIVGIYCERRHLSQSLGHLEMIVGRLDGIAMAIVTVVVVIIWLLFFQVNVVNVLVSFSSVLVALTFMVGNMGRNAFESLVLLFLIHPYDSGDRVVIDNEIYSVDDIQILHTVFKRGDGQEVYFPNFLLVSKPITNTRRSGDMSETINLDVPTTMTYPQYVALRAAIGEFLKVGGPHGGGPNDWTGKFEVMPNDTLENGHRMRLVVSAQARGNSMDGAKRWARKTQLIFFIKETLVRLGIKFTQMPLHVDLAPAPGAPPGWPAAMGASGVNSLGTIGRGGFGGTAVAASMAAAAGAPLGLSVLTGAAMQ